MEPSIFILLGGLFGPDGYADSIGMIRLGDALVPYGKVSTYTWDRYEEAQRDILALPASNKVILIGYSGGGSRVTWIANNVSPRPIKLLITYDASPTWQMMLLPGSVEKAISYNNQMPLMFGLGGGQLHFKSGKKVNSYFISQQHLLIQYNATLHGITIKAVEDAIRLE